MRLPPDGLGEPGSENMLVAVLWANGLVEPNEDRRVFPNPARFFCNKGLPKGEYCEPAAPKDPCTMGLPRPESGELE